VIRRLPRRFAGTGRLGEAGAVDPRTEPATIDVTRDQGLSITFADGYTAGFDLLTLRQGCPCATCRTLRDAGEPAWPRPGSPQPLRIVDAALNGAWGLSIAWNDGHGTGIFPFESLRRWSEAGVGFGADSGLSAPEG
jgi:DUF971 family protein